MSLFLNEHVIEGSGHYFQRMLVQRHYIAARVLSLGDNGPVFKHQLDQLTSAL